MWGCLQYEDSTDQECTLSTEEFLTLQVGVVAVGQPFPVWVNAQTALTLKVSAAVPADLVRLVLGAEMAVAPRPRVKATTPVAAAAKLPNGRGSSAEAQPTKAAPPPPAWLRIQVWGISRAGDAIASEPMWREPAQHLNECGQTACEHSLLPGKPSDVSTGY